MFANPRSPRTNALALGVFAVAYVAVMVFLFVPKSWFAADAGTPQRAALAAAAVDQPLTH
ncbi:hypothetical protein V8J36_10560 [Frigidibacter sp. MR17.14]|uniref:hypothetical protein n=1 Tax=Frigidibacter sp. MR17.14 TaxID=3126509 RepID=UPI003012E38F